MSIGTFLIVYRVYYQQRRVRTRHQTQSALSGGAPPNKAKSLFYLLFTLNLLYFILVSPVVLVTTILFRNPDEEVAYPRFKAIIYLMQYCNHSLNFIFYGKIKQTKKKAIFHNKFFILRYNITTLPSNIMSMVCITYSTFTTMLSKKISTTIKI
jgi:hypothetical protein